MPSIKKNKKYYDSSETLNESDEDLTLDDYLGEKYYKDTMIDNHHIEFTLKFEEKIKEIYLKYYYNYKYYGFLENNEFGYYDLFNIIYDNIKIKYDISIFQDDKNYNNFM